MNTTLSAIALFTLAGAASGAAPQAWSDDCASSSKAPLLASGCAALDDFMRTFNAHDAKAWAATLNYPHVRLAGGEVLVWQTPQDYAASNDVKGLADQGWSHSAWDYRHLVQSSADKLHFVVQFTRYGQGGKPLGSFPSLYVVTLRDGRWGVQARSSYAGIAVKGSAF